MTITVQFAPNPNAPFQFAAPLNGPTVNAMGTGPTYNVIVTWNVFGQRWYVNIVDQNGTLVVSRPLVASPPGYPISLTAGYFSTVMTFDAATQTFTID